MALAFRLLWLTFTMSSLTARLEGLLAEQTDEVEPGDIPSALELAETMTWSPAPWFRRPAAVAQHQAVVLRPWAWRATHDDVAPELEPFASAA